jgi:hypothetical protein
MRNYLQQDAERIKRALPEGTSVPDNANSLFVIYAVLMRAKGPDVTASDVHDAWSAWMMSQDPNHEAIRPYEKLEPETKTQDEPFLLAIKKALSVS